MKKIDNNTCETQILVCTNEKPEGKVCCKRVGGQDFFSKLKEKMKTEGLNGTRWVTRTGCLGYCNEVGTVISISRKTGERQWFSEVTGDDFDKIWSEATR